MFDLFLCCRLCLFLFLFIRLDSFHIPPSASAMTTDTDDRTVTPTLSTGEKSIRDVPDVQDVQDVQNTTPTPDEPLDIALAPTTTRGSNAEPQYVTGVKLWLIVLALSLALFVTMLDMSIVSTAIPRITNQFHSLNDVGWYGAAYQLAW